MAAWEEERRRLAASFDAIAEPYLRAHANKLEAKPFDRQVLERLAAEVRPGTVVLEVGAGPGQASGELRRRGVTTIASDAAAAQSRSARRANPGIPVLVTDLARLAVRDGSLGGIVAYYALLYGGASHLDRVFGEWRRALASRGAVMIGLHAGTGTIHATECFCRPVDITLVLRDPDDLCARLRRQGFDILSCDVRPPYADEVATERCYILAVATTPAP